MNRTFSLLLTTIAVCLLLSSCATVKKEDSHDIDKSKIEPATWAAAIQERQQISNWEIRGRLGVQTKDSGGSMDIIWQQSDADFTIHLIAPMGAGNYLIQGEKGSAEIRFPDGTKKIVNQSEDIFETVLDINLPASAVKDWLRGLPASEMPIEYIDWNTKGLLNRVKQSGWNVEMTNYSGKKTMVPYKLYLSRDDDPELSIRLVLRQWLIDN